MHVDEFDSDDVIDDDVIDEDEDEEDEEDEEGVCRGESTTSFTKFFAHSASYSCKYKSKIIYNK